MVLEELYFIIKITSPKMHATPLFCHFVVEVSVRMIYGCSLFVLPQCNDLDKKAYILGTVSAPTGERCFSQTQVQYV
jgi:hypothetical protein